MESSRDLNVSRSIPMPIRWLTSVHKLYNTSSLMSSLKQQELLTPLETLLVQVWNQLELVQK